MTTAAKQLTDRQQQVLALLEEGRTVPQIAKALKIGPTGVYGHMRNIRRAGVKIPGEQMDDATAKSNGHSDDPVLAEGVLGGGMIDVPSVIRSQMEQARIEINEIETEAIEMAERAKVLQQQKERLQETVKHHEAALNAYTVKKG